MKVKRIIALALLFTLCLSIIAVAASGDTTVYITDTGEKYHRISCGSLWNSQHAVTLQQAINRGYEPCGRCHPPAYVDTQPSPSKSIEERLEAMRDTGKATPTPKPTVMVTPTPEPEKESGWERVAVIAIVIAIYASPLLYIIFMVLGEDIKSRRRSKLAPKEPKQKSRD